MDGSRRRPRGDGWRRRSPLVRMTCVRCLLASREKVPAAWRVKGEGMLATTTTSVGGTIGGADIHSPFLVARPVSPRKILHPHVSRCAFLSLLLSLFLFPTFIHQDVTVRLFRFCLPRESLELTTKRARCDRRRQKYRRRFALLAFDTLHRFPFGAEASAPSWPNLFTANQPIHAAPEARYQRCSLLCTAARWNL